MDRLKDKVAIITGSTGGIGVGIARLYAAEGAQVIVCGRRAERGQTVVDTITAEGGKASFHAMDITVPSSIEKLVEDTVSTYGRIDVLVNNAANVGLKDGRVDEVKNPQGGSIVNIGSMAACGGDLGATAYACAKAGVDALTKSVALQYGKDNIRCNCVRPGLIVTPDNEPRIPQVLKDIFLSNIMVNRYGCPEDIGHACVYFGSDESAYVSGQVITVDGGLNSHVPTVAQFRAIDSRTW